MTRICIFFLSTLLAANLPGQTFPDFVDYLGSLPTPQRQIAADSFIASTDFPLTESDTLAHFIYQGDAGSVGVAGDFNGWNPDPDPLSAIDGTDLWYRTRIFPSHARLDYKLVVDGNWILDPLHGQTISGGFGPNSELAMPDYVQPWEIEENPDIPHGTIETLNFESAVMGESYQVKIYLPPSYSEVTNRAYPSIYVHDGTEYLTLGAADHVLDNLIAAGTISEVIGIFIRPNNRNEEYAGSKRMLYQQFIAEELVDYIDIQYRTLPVRNQRATLGTSFGGNISGLLTHNHFEVFGKCGLHSPAFWPNGYQTSNMLQDGLSADARFAAVWGTFEGSLTTNSEQVMTTLADSGHETYANAYPEGHSWGLWRATLDELLIFLFPPGLTSVSPVPKEDRGLRVHPNPCQQPCQLEFSPAPEVASDWILYAGSGVQMASGRVQAGQSRFRIPAKLPGGVYWLHLEAPRSVAPVVLE